MYYREYKIYSGDLDTYNRWLKLCDLQHSDRSYELFVLDSFIEYAKETILKKYLKNKIIVSFDEETENLQAFNEKGECIDDNIAWVRMTDRGIESAQIVNLRHKLDEIENGKTRC